LRERLGRFANGGFQERLEATPFGRALISALIVATIVSLVVWNVPDSELKAKLLPVVRPYVNVVGLDQNWGVFSPDPRRETLEMFARVSYADGTSETVRVPTGDAFVGAYWDYRWLKWVEWTTMDVHKDLWKPAAAWFARQAQTSGKRPVRVQLFRRWYVVLPPGPGPNRTPWHQFNFYTLTVVQPGAGRS
jgi:hypothetical protein